MRLRSKRPRREKSVSTRGAQARQKVRERENFSRRSLSIDDGSGVATIGRHGGSKSPGGTVSTWLENGGGASSSGKRPGAEQAGGPGDDRSGGAGRPADVRGALTRRRRGCSSTQWVKGLPLLSLEAQEASLEVARRVRLRMKTRSSVDRRRPAHQEQGACRRGRRKLLSIVGESGPLPRLENAASTRDLQATYQARRLTAIAKAIDTMDRYTCRPLDRVATYAIVPRRPPSPPAEKWSRFRAAERHHARHRQSRSA